MRILYLGGFSNLGGATKSLIFLLENVKKIDENIDMFILTTKKLETYFKEKGYYCESLRWISRFDITKYGFYKGMRWLIFIRELFFLPFSLFKLYEFVKKQRIDIIHLNDVTFFFYAWFIKLFFKNIKVVMHVRAVVSEQNSLRMQYLERILNKYVDFIIPIDETVKKSLPDSVKKKTKVVHNGFETKQERNKFDNKDKDTLKIGFIGVLYRAKGIYELMEAAKVLINEKKLKIKFLIAGENTREIKNKFIRKLMIYFGFFQDSKHDLMKFINENNLNDSLIYLGFLKDVDKFYSEIDLLIFPSYLNAAGRPVFEAGFYGVPGVIAVNNPERDTAVHMETAICIPCPPKVEYIVKAIELLYHDRNLLQKLGDGANKLSKANFDPYKNALEIHSIYKKLLKELS